jgi:addiction module HigA family antidote
VGRSTSKTESAFPNDVESPEHYRRENHQGPVSYRPFTPEEILKETLDDLGINLDRLAYAPHVPVAGQRGIAGETALRLARHSDTPPDYWFNMQAQYDIEAARDEWDAKIQSEVLPRRAA